MKIKRERNNPSQKIPKFGVKGTKKPVKNQVRKD